MPLSPSPPSPSPPLATLLSFTCAINVMSIFIDSFNNFFACWDVLFGHSRTRAGGGTGACTVGCSYTEVFANSILFCAPPPFLFPIVCLFVLRALDVLSMCFMYYSQSFASYSLSSLPPSLSLPLLFFALSHCLSWCWSVLLSCCQLFSFFCCVCFHLIWILILILIPLLILMQFFSFEFSLRDFHSHSHFDSHFDLNLFSFVSSIASTAISFWLCLQINLTNASLNWAINFSSLLQFLLLKTANVAGFCISLQFPFRQ